MLIITILTPLTPCGMNFLQLCSPVKLLQLRHPVGRVAGDGLQRGDEVRDVLGLALVVCVNLENNLQQLVA